MGDMYECPQPVRVGATIPPRAGPPLSRYGPTTAAPKRDVVLTASRSEPTSSDDYECPAAVVIRPQPVRTAPMVTPSSTTSPRPLRRAHNHPVGAPKRNNSGEKTSYRASFLIFTLLMVLSVSLQVSAFILSMSAGNDAEQLREQQKKYQQKTDGRFKAMEAQLAKQKAALAKMQKDFESAAKPAGKEETTVIGSDVHGALDASMSLDKILRGKMSKRLTRATPDAKATPMPQHATTPVPAIPAYFMAEIHYDPKDCSDWYMAGSVEDGPQDIQPRGSPTKHEVYCKMDQDSGWTVIHARKSPKLDFYQRSWDDFKKGFKQGGWESFWLGNDLIHNITRQATYELKVIGNMDGVYPTLAAHYSTFKVGSEADRYRLELGEFLGGEHGDVLRENDGGQFVTVDRNDESTFGWWESSQTGDPSLQIPFMRMKDLTMMIKPTKEQA